MTVPLEAVLRRERAMVVAALAILVLLAWGWLLLGAGMSSEMGPPAWSPTAALLTFSMWWVMMAAMMVPAAAPVILLYARAAPRDAGRPPTRHFLAGYLLVWGLFSLLAAALQGVLQVSGMLAPMTLGSAAKWLSAAILIAAGVYQLSPLKEACLAHCRNPAAFLSRHYRPGRFGAFRLGIVHGAYCVGCCWLLMALLFVGGVMNLAWIALLTLLVAAEKLLPGGRRVALVAGLGFVGWGIATALV